MSDRPDILTKKNTQCRSVAYLCLDKDDANENMDQLRALLAEKEVFFVSVCPADANVTYLAYMDEEIVLRTDFFITLDEYPDEKDAFETFQFSEKMSKALSEHNSIRCQPGGGK